MQPSPKPRVSLVVVCHNMARELPRTLASLCPPYQRGCTREDIEILVIDNGSAEPVAAGAFRALDADIRVLTVPNPAVSPVPAVNLGLAEARAGLIGVWIDGARLASPGLISACLAASALHSRAVIATLNYQLGPALQYLSGETGYDKAVEEGLLESIGWLTNGYRLFEIATCELRSGPAGPMLESNALFLSRALWQELGGYDPAFVEPGGGLVNPDTLIRACALPESQLIRILGEGTFHQIHGGLSTSTVQSAIKTLQEGTRAYIQRRGQPPGYVRTPGWLFDGPAHRLLATDGTDDWPGERAPAAAASGRLLSA